MVKHIVMWRMAESEDKEQRAKDIKENLEALKGEHQYVNRYGLIKGQKFDFDNA